MQPQTQETNYFPPQQDSPIKLWIDNMRTKLNEAYDELSYLDKQIIATPKTSIEAYKGLENKIGEQQKIFFQVYGGLLNLCKYRAIKEDKEELPKYEKLYMDRNSTPLTINAFWDMKEYVHRMIENANLSTIGSVSSVPRLMEEISLTRDINGV